MCSNINEYSGRKPLYDRDSKIAEVIEKPQIVRRKKRQRIM